MALNFGLLDPDAPAKIANSLYAGQQERQKNMMAQQQMQVGAQQLETGRLQQQQSQMQMDQMIRDRDALAKLQQQFVANGKSPDLEVNADAMIQSGISHYVDIGFQLKQKLMDQKRYAAIMGGEPVNATPPAAPPITPAAPATPAAAPYEPAPGAVPIRQGFSPGTVITTFDGQGNVVADNQFANRPSQASEIATQIQAYNNKYKTAQNVTSNNIAPVAAPVANQMAPNPAAANVDTLRRQRNALLAMGTPQAVAAARALDADIAIASKEPVYHNVTGVGLVDPRTGKIIVAEQDKATELQRNFEYAKGQGFKGNIFDYERQLKEAGRALGAPRAEQPLEKVIDPVTGKIVFASREEALKGRMTPASSENKPLTALQQQALKKDFANDTSKVKSAIATADELEKLTDELVGNPDKKIAPHPGLSGITGYQGLLPSFAASPVTSGNAAKAEQKLDTFKGKIKTLGRSLASLDGKLGNMAVQEWQFISDAVQNIKPTAGNLDEQMRDVVRQARLLAKNLQDKFDLTYEDTTLAAAPNRPAPAANVITNPQYPGFSIGKP